MRWSELFDDLGGQLEHELEHERRQVRDEDERLRLGRLTLRDRLDAVVRAPAAPAVVQLDLVGGERLDVALASCGRDWIAGALLGDAVDERGSALVPLSSVRSVALDEASLASSLADAPRDGVDLGGRLGLAVALRDLARRRAGVDVALSRGVVHGTIDRVARDHVDLAEHERGVPRRREAVRGVRLVAHDAIRWIRF